jgi:formylglycine-generating enzyme
MFDKTTLRLLLAAALVASALTARANVFSLGGTETSLSFVTVGDPGNVADSAYDSGTGSSTSPGTGLGSVPYTFQIGTYDVTTGQYVAFLNAVATKSDPYVLYNSNMALDASFPTIGISQTRVAGTYSYAVVGTAPGAANMPVFCVTWGDAARFCNWLQNGQPTSGTEAAGTTETGAYTLNGATSQALLYSTTRNAGATYFIPSENEWYKAAYFDPGSGTYWAYPTQSNTAPINTLPDTGNHANFYDVYGTGNLTYTDSTDYLTPVGSFVLSPGPFGTYDMGGDVFQWNEAQISGSFRGLRGGSWGINSNNLASSARGDNNPTNEDLDIGFRVASSVAVPEPGSLALLLACAVGFGIWRQRLNAGWHRGAARRTAQPESHGDAPTILPFPSRSSPKAAHRAA